VVKAKNLSIRKPICTFEYLYHFKNAVEYVECLKNEKENFLQSTKKAVLKEIISSDNKLILNVIHQEKQHELIYSLNSSQELSEELDKLLDALSVRSIKDCENLDVFFKGANSMIGFVPMHIGKSKHWHILPLFNPNQLLM
jgi:hypothetical protein